MNEKGENSTLANLKIFTESLLINLNGSKLTEQEESLKRPMSLENILKRCQRIIS